MEKCSACGHLMEDLRTDCMCGRNTISEKTKEVIKDEIQRLQNNEGHAFEVTGRIQYDRQK